MGIDRWGATQGPASCRQLLAWEHYATGMAGTAEIAEGTAVRTVHRIASGRVMKVAGALALCASLALPRPAYADKVVTQPNEEYERAQAEMDRITSAYMAIAAEQDQTLAELEDVRGKIEDNESRADDVRQQIDDCEAELAEKENILRNTQIQMEQQKLDVRQNVLEYGMQVDRLRRAYEQQKALYEDKLIAREEYLKAEEDYKLAKQKYDLMAERSKQDSLYRGTQIDRMEESLENMQLNMSMIRRRKSNLIVKAPIDGELGLLDVVLGQSIASGTKIGQINSVGTYKVEAQIDEHYIDRVVAGLSATFERQGETYSTVIRKVYPEVRDGKFKADFKFGGEQPDNIRAGQTYYLNLQLGQSEEAVIIPRGTFYQKTGGKWIYVVNKEGTKAVKREIRIGRQNPQYYEVLEGLEPSERVITSGYDTYGDSDVLVF